MNKISKIATLLTLGVLGAKKIQAVKENRSLSSLILQDIGNHVIKTHNFHDPAEYHKAFTKSIIGFQLPKYAKQLYQFDYNTGYDETLERIPSGKNPACTIFYLHGGAFWSDPTPFHFKTLKTISEANNARIIMPVYPKAPHHKATEALEFIEKNYLTLLDSGESEIILMGDSAGGGMVLSLIQILRDKQIKLPKLAVLLSPWLDITNSNPQIESISKYDFLLGDYKELTFQGSEYAGNLDIKDPKVSPIYGNLDNLPPIYQFVGSYDIFYADVLKLQNLADENGYEISTHYFSKMPHAFSLLPIPEGRQSLKMITDIIKNTK